MVDNLQMILEQMDNIKDQMAGIQNHFDERMTTHEELVQNHFGMCRELCMTKISHVEKSAEKAHERLDDHKKSIKCLDGWKNQMKGRMWILPFVVTPIISGLVAILVYVITKTYGGT